MTYNLVSDKRLFVRLIDPKYAKYIPRLICYMNSFSLSHTHLTVPFLQSFFSNKYVNRQEQQAN